MATAVIERVWESLPVPSTNVGPADLPAAADLPGFIQSVCVGGVAREIEANQRAAERIEQARRYAQDAAARQRQAADRD